MQFENLEGRTLGQYELRSIIGVGNMGAVYAAFQQSLEREVAVKVLPPALATQSGYLERFRREAATAAALEHPHIVPVYDFGNQGSITYVAMRLLRGGSLKDRLQEHREREGSLPSVNDIGQMVSQLAGALDYAHSKGVIHRDIKPGNVMFDDHGTAILVDFGIAKLTHTSQVITQIGQTPGTPLFMAPEMWREENVVPQTDQYALAVMLYYALVGKPPFESETLFNVMQMHMNAEPPAIHEQRPDIPGALSSVLRRALAKDPDERYSTMQEFANAFNQAVNYVEAAAPAPTPTPPVTTTPPPVTTTPPPVPSSPVTSSSPTTGPVIKPWYAQPLTWLVLVVLIVLVGGLSYVVLSSGDDETELSEAATTQTAEFSGTETALFVAGQAPSATATDSVTPTVDAEATQVALALTADAASSTPTNTSTPDRTATAQLTADAQATADAALTLTAEAASPTSTNTSTPDRTATAQLTVDAQATADAALTLTAEATSPTLTNTVPPTPDRTATAQLTIDAANALTIEAASSTPTNTSTPDRTATAQLTVDAQATADTALTLTAEAASPTATITNTPSPTDTLTHTPTDTATTVPSNTPTRTITVTASNTPDAAVNVQATFDAVRTQQAAQLQTQQADEEADSTSTFTPPPPTATPTLIPGEPAAINAADVNLRSGPTTNHPVVETAPRGLSVEVLAFTEDGEWAYIRYNEDQYAWIAEFLLNVEGNIDAVPDAASIGAVICPAPTNRFAETWAESFWLLGCPDGQGTTLRFPTQRYENGFMFYRLDRRTVFVVSYDGFWQTYPNTYDSTVGISCWVPNIQEGPFGQVFCDNPSLGDTYLGTPIEEAKPNGLIRIQQYESGIIVEIEETIAQPLYEANRLEMR